MPTLTVSHLWNQNARGGSWSPYVVTVRNDGQTTFAGTVALVADTGYGPIPLGGFPEYDAVVIVPPGSQRAVTAYVLESANGYHAELRDGQGSVLTTARVPTSGGAGAAVAIVSDVPQVQQRLDALLRSQSQLDAAVSQFSAGQAFPADVVRLSGLNAVILDEFDTGSLSALQLRALTDFVGLGGTLILAGGAGARRTLGPLPGELVPLRPTGVGTASLAPVAELGGLATAVTAPVSTGDVAAGARVTLAAPGGTPLIVEAGYGAGDVVELAFDPLAAPFDGRIDLAAAAWVQALARGLTGVAGSGSMQLGRLGFGAPPFGGPPVGSGPGSATGYPGYLGQALAEAPAAASPPFGLLAVLFVAYLLAVSGLAYSALRAAGRRGLLWVVVPVTAIVCTAGAYLAGFGTRGADFQVVQVQVERLAPGGVVETSEFDGVLAPRRGDVTLTAPPGALVTTAGSAFGPFAFGPFATAGDPARITVANPAGVTFPNVAVWDLRPVQTLSVTHGGEGAGAGMPIETQLRLRAGRLQGQVVNHTSRTVHDVQLISPTAHVALAGSVAPGATAAVDAPVTSSTVSALGGKVGVGIPNGVFAPPSARNAGQTMVALAATEVAVRPGEWALVGLVDRTETLRVGGERPHGSGRAFVVEPARLLSVDSAAAAAPPQLVSTYTSGTGALIQVYEQVVPPGLAGRVTLTTSLLPGKPPTVAPSLEVYDQESHTWRAVTGSAAAAPLTPGEVADGVIRTRVTSDGSQVQVSLSDVP